MKRTKNFKIVLSIICILSAITLSACTSNKAINIKDYIKSDIVSGYNNWAEFPTKAYQILDADALEEDICLQGGQTENFNLSDDSYIFDVIKVSADNDGYLKNGDVINYEITYDVDRLEAITGLKFSGNGSIKNSYKVDGLKELTEIDIFDYVQVNTTWADDSDYSWVEFDCSDELPDQISNNEICFDKWSNTITINPNDDELSDTELHFEYTHSVKTRNEEITVQIDSNEEELATLGFKLVSTAKTYSQSEIPNIPEQ